MFRSIISLGLVSLVASSPLSFGGTQSPTSTSKGFTLVVHVTKSDFDTPIQGQFISGIHVGAGLDKVGLSAEKGRVFYQNGTETERADRQTTIITDSATPPYPAGLKLVAGSDDNDPSDTSLDIGFGSKGLSVGSTGSTSAVLPDSFLACEEPLAYYGGKEFVVIRHGSLDASVPGKCKAVRLVPQCAELEALPEDAGSSHEFAFDTPCYEDATIAT